MRSCKNNKFWYIINIVHTHNGTEETNIKKKNKKNKEFVDGNVKIEDLKKKKWQKTQDMFRVGKALRKKINNHMSHEK